MKFELSSNVRKFKIRMNMEKLEGMFEITEAVWLCQEPSLMCLSTFQRYSA